MFIFSVSVILQVTYYSCYTISTFLWTVMSCSSLLISLWLPLSVVPFFVKSDPIREVTDQPVKIKVSNSLVDLVLNSCKNGLLSSLFTLATCTMLVDYAYKKSGTVIEHMLFYCSSAWVPWAIIVRLLSAAGSYHGWSYIVPQQDHEDVGCLQSSDLAKSQRLAVTIQEQIKQVSWISKYLPVSQGFQKKITGT